MNALHDKFSERGLIVLGISNEARSTLEGWQEKRQPTYPVVSAPTAAKEYGVSGYPTYFLVSGSGEILAGPQHGKFSDAQVEEALSTVVLFPELPKSSKLNALRKATEKADIAGVSKELARLAKDTGLTEEEQAATAAVEKTFQRLTEGALKTIAALGKGPDYLRSTRQLEELADKYEGLPVEAEAKAQLGRFKSDATIKANVRAMQTLERIEKRYDPRKRSDRDKLEKALENFLKRNKDPHAGQAAQAILDGLRA